MTEFGNRGGIVSTGLKLAPLDLNVEHEFELTDVKFFDNVQTPFGLKNQIQFIFKETGKDEGYHRVWIKMNESYAEKSNLIAFLRRISPKPIEPGMQILLGDHIVIGMRITAKVVEQIDKKTGAPRGYYDFVEASIRPFKAKQTPSMDAIKKTIAGAKDGAQAFELLFRAGTPKEVIDFFMEQSKKGIITYPVK